MGHSTGQSAGAPRLRDGVAFCVGVFLAARVLLSLSGVLGVGALPESPIWQRYASSPAQERAVPGFHNVIDGTFRWDADWFAAIAEHGYAHADERFAAFFPAYPLATGALARLTGMSAFTAAEAVSNLAFLGALVVLFALTALELSIPAARRTVVLVALSPTSFFFLAPYSESLFLLLALLAFWSVRRDRWAAGGIAGTLAAVTRGLGITLAPALALEAMSGRETSWREKTGRLAMAALVLVGPLLYSLWWLAAAGNVLAPWSSEHQRGRGPQIPLVTYARGVGDAFGANGFQGRAISGLNLLSTTLAVLLLVFGWRMLRGSYRAYVALGLLVPLSYPFSGPALASMPRFVIVLFPLYWVVAEKVKDRAWFTAIVVAGSIAFIGLSVSFMNWRFVA